MDYFTYYPSITVNSSCWQHYNILYRLGRHLVSFFFFFFYVFGSLSNSFCSSVFTVRETQRHFCQCQSFCFDFAFGSASNFAYNNGGSLKITSDLISLQSHRTDIFLLSQFCQFRFSIFLLIYWHDSSTDVFTQRNYVKYKSNKRPVTWGCSKIANTVWLAEVINLRKLIC